MISEGLTSEQLNKILSGPGDAIGSVYLEKFGFSWSPSASQPSMCMSIGLLDEDTVLIAWGEGSLMHWWTSDDGGVTSSSGSFGVGAPIDNISIADNSGVVFFSSGATVYKVDISTGSPVSLVSLPSDVQHLAATSADTAHAIVRDQPALRLVSIDTGVATYSEVYWPWVIDGFDAKSTEDSDVVIISGRGSNYKSVVAQGTNAAWETKRTTLVASLVFRNGVYSNHYPIEVGDDEAQQSVGYASGFSTPKGVGAIYRIVGYGNDMIAVSTSTHGRLWELFIPLSFDPSATPMLATTSSHIYYFGGTGLYVSPINYRLGIHNDSTRMDVTDLVLGGGLPLRVKSGLRSLKLQDTPELATYLSDDQPVLVFFEAGYHYQDGSAPQTLIYMGESDTAEHSKDDSGQWTWTLNSTDVLAWLDRKSGYFKEFPALAGGYDPYTDPAETGTEYGGMGHTYAVERSWRTPKHDDHGWMLAPSEYADGRVVAFSTLAQNVLNGFVLAECLWEEAGDEEVGLVVRGVSAYIMCATVYDPDENKLSIIHWTGDRVEGSDDEYKQVEIASTTISLSSGVWLRYAVRYAKHQVWRSDNGVDWVEVLSAVSLWGIYPGSFGVIGHVITEDDPSDEYDPPNIYPPWEPPPGYLIEQVGSPAAFVHYGNDGRAYVYITPDIGDLEPTWYEITGGQFEFEPSSLQFNTKTLDDNALYLSGNGAMEYTEDALDIVTYPWEDLSSPSTEINLETVGTAWGTERYIPRLMRRPDSNIDLLTHVVVGGTLHVVALVFDSGSIVSTTVVGPQKQDAARHVSWYDSENLFVGYHAQGGILYYIFNTGSVCSILMADGSPVDEDDVYTVVREGEIVMLPAPDSLTPDYSIGEHYTVCPVVEGVQNIQYKISAELKGCYRSTAQGGIRGDRYGLGSVAVGVHTWIDYFEDIEDLGKSGCTKLETGLPQAQGSFDLDAVGDSGFVFYVEGNASTRFCRVDGCPMVAFGSMEFMGWGDSQEAFIYHVKLPEGDDDITDNLWDACSGAGCVSEETCCKFTPGDPSAPSYYSDGDFWRVCPYWAIEVVERLYDVGWITENYEDTLVISTDDNNGPCEYPGTYAWDIPVDIFNGGYNIAQRDGYQAAINRERDVLYLSDDGFLTVDTIPLPTDIVAPYYPGLDFFYIEASLYLALYGQNGVVLYDISEKIFINKTGNLGTILQGNSHNLYTANGITVKDAETVSEV